MKVLLAALFVAILTLAGSLPASAQVVGGKLIGVDDDPGIGDPKAKVTIIEFGDYQCPSCRMFWREVEPRLKKDYINTGKVRMVFRDFPIVQIHPESIMAAMAADCANDQGKYWEYHDKVYGEQDKNGDDLVRFTANDLKKWAKDLKLDTAAFGTCLDSQKYKEEVLSDKADGDGVGIQGTPTFFINGHVIGGAQPYPVFKKLIDELLK